MKHKYINMKNAILLLFLLFGLSANGQITISSGSNRFIVNNISYPLNAVAMSMVANDTTLIGFIATPNKTIVPHNPISTLKRSGGVAFTNRQAIINYYDSFAVSATGGGVYMAIGSPVAGGTADYYLKLDGSGNLSQTTPTITYLIPSTNITIDSNIDGTIKTYSVSASGGGSISIGEVIGGATKNFPLYADGDYQLRQYSVIPWCVRSDSNTYTGYITRAYLEANAGGTTIYTGDGILSGNRTVDCNGNKITISGADQITLSGTTLILANIPDYTDDAAAIGGGLTSGTVYKTTTAGSTFLKIVP